MTDTFKNHMTGPRDPIEAAENVIPNDTTDLTVFSRAIHVGAPGDLRVTMLSGQITTFTLGQGWHPIRVRRIWATGTTADAIISCS